MNLPTLIYHSILLLLSLNHQFFLFHLNQYRRKRRYHSKESNRTFINFGSYHNLWQISSRQRRKQISNNLYKLICNHFSFLINLI